MRKTILIYGISLAGLGILLRLLEFRFMVHDLSMELYLGMIALLFTVIGIWAGRKLVNRRMVKTVTAAGSPLPETRISLQDPGISRRELDVLQLMAKGHSNQEIADLLFVSLNTVKTHSANLFSKLDVKRRTQAVEKAKQLTII